MPKLVRPRCGDCPARACDRASLGLTWQVPFGSTSTMAARASGPSATEFTNKQRPSASETLGISECLFAEACDDEAEGLVAEASQPEPMPVAEPAARLVQTLGNPIFGWECPKKKHK